MSEISVVIPCHNEEAGIDRCLQHVVAQSGYQGLVQEILVVDDGSNDRSPEIVLAFAREHPGVHLVTNQENLGLAKSVNRGFSLAKSEFVLVLHADCILEDRDYLAAMVRIAAASPQTAVVTSRYVIKNLEGSTFRNRLFLLLNFVAVGWEGEQAGVESGHSVIEIGFSEFKCDIVRKQIFLDMGGFTERLFACSEDQYLCADIRRAGYSIRMALDRVYTMDFGSHQDSVSKVMAKQVTYAAATIHVFWKKGGGAVENVSFWNKNRMYRSVNRMTQLLFPPCFFFMVILLFLLGQQRILWGLGGAYLVLRALFYVLPNRKYLYTKREFGVLAFWGIVADILYFYGIMKGTVLTLLNRTIR
jgi:glycosyltransferase involved in cell wall biosynthesis